MNGDSKPDINVNLHASIQETIDARRQKKRLLRSNHGINDIYENHPATTIQGATYGKPQRGSKKYQKDPRMMTVAEIKRAYKTKQKKEKNITGNWGKRSSSR